MAERRAAIAGEQIGLIIASSDCSILARVLNDLSAPTSVVQVRELAKQQVERDTARGIPPLHDITDRTLNLGLRRMKRFGMAAYENRKWVLTEQGKHAVRDAFAPLNSVVQ